MITYLEVGEDGLIYGGGYPSGEVFSLDTTTGAFTRMGVAVEGEQYARSMAYVPELDTLFVGTEGSRMHMVAINVATGEKTTIPSPEWATTEARHYHLHYVGEQEAVGTRSGSTSSRSSTSMVAGTIGGRDINTGILVHYDTATRVRTDLGAPIDGLSIASLTHKDNLLIGGTSIEVLGGESPHPEARLFIMDLDTRELVWDGAPIAGARDYVEVTMDDEGFLWGLTSQGIVFKFDLETKEVLRQVTVGAAGGIWGMGTLEFGPDGLLYGATAQGEVFVVDPESLETKKIADGEHAVVDDAGRVYFGRDGHLFRATPEEDPFPDTTAPVVEPIDLTLVKSGEQVSIQVEATDLRTLTCTAAGPPEGLTIDPDTGLISGVHDWVGTSLVTVTVEDSRGNASQVSFRIVVEGPPARR